MLSEGPQGKIHSIKGSPLEFNVDDQSPSTNPSSPTSPAPTLPMAKLLPHPASVLGEETEFTIEIDNVGPQVLTVLVTELTSTKRSAHQEVEIPGPCQFKLIFTPTQTGEHIIELSSPQSSVVLGSPLSFMVTKSKG